MAPYGQTFSQLEQPLHIISSGWAVHGLQVRLSLHRRPMTFAAAADACATVSGMSFGPWHVPERNTPAVGLSTGRSFGCASVKKSFVSIDAVSIVAMLLADLSGSMAAARTTMSASIWSWRLSSKSLACTFSLPPSGTTLPTMPLM